MCQGIFNCVDKILLEHKILPNKKGYKYLKKVTTIVLQDEQINLVLAYEQVARCFHVKKSAVEKGISNAIERSFDSVAVAEKYGNLVDKNKGKLTNKQFIKIVIDNINHNL